MSHDRDRRRMLLAGVGAVGALAVARSARAATCGDTGPLGPTGPTMRQVFDKIAETDEGVAEARIPIQSLGGSATAQYLITQRGVYYFTDNIVGVAGMSCIEVDADDVEIEGDGFCIVGVPGVRSCITTVGAHEAIVLCDISIVSWDERCIDMPSSKDCYAETLWFRKCQCPPGTYLLSFGEGGIVDDCNVLECSCAHLRVGAHGKVEETVIRGCTLALIQSPGPATIEDNFLESSTNCGIDVTTGAVVIGNRLVNVNGIHVGGDSTVAENDLSGCANGIVVDGSHVTVEENHVSSGGGSGISVLSPATAVLVDSNHVSGCASTGILVEANCLSLVIRNAVSSSNLVIPPYTLGAGNTYGTIVTAVGTGDLGGSGTLNDVFTNLAF